LNRALVANRRSERSRWALQCRWRAESDAQSFLVGSRPFSVLLFSGSAEYTPKRTAEGPPPPGSFFDLIAGRARISSPMLVMVCVLDPYGVDRVPPTPRGPSALLCSFSSYRSIRLPSDLRLNYIRERSDWQKKTGSFMQPNEIIIIAMPFRPNY